MSEGCVAVCDKVIRKLKDAGFKISSVGEQSHRDTLKALDKCVIKQK
jgi:GH35 family endo-1,4-beta-xylanase